MKTAKRGPYTPKYKPTHIVECVTPGCFQVVRQWASRPDWKPAVRCHICAERFWRTGNYVDLSQAPLRTQPASSPPTPKRVRDMRATSSTFPGKNQA